MKTHRQGAFAVAEVLPRRLLEALAGGDHSLEETEKAGAIITGDHGVLDRWLDLHDSFDLWLDIVTP